MNSAQAAQMTEIPSKPVAISHQGMTDHYREFFNAGAVKKNVVVDDQGNVPPYHYLPSGALIQYAAGGTAPTGFLFCDGTVYDIARFPVLGRKLTNLYGGDGVTTFGVPDMRGRQAIGTGQGAGLTNRVLAATGGAEGHTDVAAHTHTLMGEAGGATANTVSGNTLADHEGYRTGPTDVPLDSTSIASTGVATVDHMDSFLVLNWLIKTISAELRPELCRYLYGACSRHNELSWLNSQFLV